MIGERGSDESAREAYGASSKGELDVKVAAGLCCDGCHEHGHREVEAANEGVIEGCGARKDLVVDVIGQEDAERLHWGFSHA